ncbi:hypothetical protein ACVIRM_006003 [Rhizobium laguerreae]
MLTWFRKLMPREERFFDLFAQHTKTVVGAAKPSSFCPPLSIPSAMGNDARKTMS